VSRDSSKLPRGRHKLPRDTVLANQRQRLLTATAGAVAEHGYPTFSVRHVLERAGVSRTSFYEQFDDKHECVIVAYDAAFERLTSAIFDACASSPDWPAGVAAAVGAALDFAAESPEQARLLVISHAAVADPRLSRRALAAQDQLVGLLRAGRERYGLGRSPLRLTEQALVGGAMSVVGAQLLADRVDPQVKPELVQLVLTPYLGAEEAVRVALAA